MKCKLDKGVKVIPLSTYQHKNPSEFGKQGQATGGYGQDRTLLKGYNENPTQQYSIRVIFSKNGIISTGDKFFIL